MYVCVYLNLFALFVHTIFLKVYLLVYVYACVCMYVCLWGSIIHSNANWRQHMLSSLSSERGKLLKLFDASKDRLERSRKELDVLQELSNNLCTYACMYVYVGVHVYLYTHSHSK
jgi:hypothetical protein